jgi:oxaloacetate decarboxylase alpha subunit
VPAPAVSAANAVPVAAPLAGNIWKVVVKAGQAVKEGDVLVILEAMKMETEIRAGLSGTVNTIQVKEGDAVAVGDCMLTLI